MEGLEVRGIVMISVLCLAKLMIYTENVCVVLKKIKFSLKEMVRQFLTRTQNM